MAAESIKNHLLDRFGILYIFPLEFFKLKFSGAANAFQLHISENASIVLVTDLHEL
jgi:hypothetical protein